MAGRSRRTVAQWNALSKSQRNRWKQQYGGDEKAARREYLAGAKLALRGHAFTPDRPEQALRNPERYPRYVATHTERLNAIARDRGLKQHGTGPRGEVPETRSYADSGGDFTWVHPRGTLSAPDWRFSSVFRTEPEAQLYARRSWAPAGVVQIEDNLWEQGSPQPPVDGIAYRFEVWFGYPEPVKKRRRKT